MHLDTSLSQASMALRRIHDPRAEAHAERLLAEYLRNWGLRDPATIAAHCRSWVRRVTQGQSDHPAWDGSEDYLARTALAQAMNDMDGWLDHLARIVSA